MTIHDVWPWRTINNSWRSFSYPTIQGFSMGPYIKSITTFRIEHNVYMVFVKSQIHVNLVNQNFDQWQTWALKCTLLGYVMYMHIVIINEDLMRRLDRYSLIVWQCVASLRGFSITLKMIVLASNTSRRWPLTLAHMYARACREIFNNYIEKMWQLYQIVYWSWWGKHLTWWCDDVGYNIAWFCYCFN